MHVISLIVRIRLPLVSSHSDQYQKSYGCFSYSDVVGRARSRVKWSIWRAISSTTEQIEMSFGMMAPDILTAIMWKGFQVTWSISGWSAPWSAGIRYFTVFPSLDSFCPSLSEYFEWWHKTWYMRKLSYRAFSAAKKHVLVRSGCWDIAPRTSPFHG